MKNVFKVLGIIALVAVIGFGIAACSDDDDGGGDPVWPVEFGAEADTSWGDTTTYIKFTYSTGGKDKNGKDIKVANMSFFNNSMASPYFLESIKGKTIKVKSSLGTSFTLCTNWNIQNNTLTLSGGDSLFSSIMNTPLVKN